VGIEELEAKKENIEGDEGKEKDGGEEKTKEKRKEVVDISNENKVLPIVVLLKEETIEIAIQNNVWKYQDKATRMDTKWIKIRNQKLIYGLVVPRIVSPTLAKQTTITPCSRIDTIHMLLEMEYLYPLLLNLEAYCLLHKF